jgi:glucose-1-phosphate thymidylyltransferase
MKGIILAGGTGSRLFPLTKVTNKHLLPVGRYPMIVHPIMKLRQAGVYSILIVTGREHMGDMIELLGSGAAFGVDFTYRVQDEAGGIAQALGLAEQFVGEDTMCVILGDNVFSDPLTPFVEQFDKEHKTDGAMVLLKEVPDPHRFGVAEVENGIVYSIVEKPKEPKSNYAVIGVYIYDNRVFNMIRKLTPSGRGELEITDVNNAYLKEMKLHYSVLEGWWTDAGTFESDPWANELAEDVNWNLPDLLPAPVPPGPIRPGFIDPYMKVGWPPRYAGYMAMQPQGGMVQPGMPTIQATPIIGEPSEAFMTDEDRKIARRKRERDAGAVGMPKFKDSPKDPFPHDFDEEHAPASTTSAETAEPVEMKDMADMIFAAEEVTQSSSQETTRPELYQKTSETLPDNANTIIMKDGVKSNTWVPIKYYDYLHFPKKVYTMNYDKFEHKIALATQVDRAIMSMGEVTRRFPDDDDRHIRVGYYFTHKEREYLLACISLGDSVPAQPHVLIWIKLDIFQDVETIGLKVVKFRFDNDEARLVYIDSLEQIPGLIEALVRKINLRRGIKDKDESKTVEQKKDDSGATTGRSF